MNDDIHVVTNDLEKCDIALEGLYEVDDPEVGLNIVDLGLIYKIEFEEEKKRVFCEMTLTTQFCPMGDSITSNAVQALTDAFPGWEVDLNLTFEPAWDFSKISPGGREFLGR